LRHFETLAVGSKQSRSAHGYARQQGAILHAGAAPEGARGAGRRQAWRPNARLGGGGQPERGVVVRLCHAS
jgi:hypothetical protein